jgi:hypothetical protein
MRPISINRSNLSQALWEAIFDHSEPQSFSMLSSLLAETVLLENLREQADYNTGSISTSAIWSIFSSCLYFQPKVVAEVGTFIGKSTFAAASAMDVATKNSSGIFTCDSSNDIKLNLKTKTPIIQFPKTASTDMFTELAKKGIRCDMLFLDGRLQEADLPLLSLILHDQSVFLLDDFEGTEKGCINSMLIMQSLDKTHHLVYPPSSEALLRRGFKDRCAVAMIVPRSLVMFTNQ